MLLVVVLVASTSFYAFYKNECVLSKIHSEQRITQQSLAKILHKEKQIGLQKSVGQFNTKKVSGSWLDVQKKVKDSVVQIFTDVNAFNWLEPYKTPAQGEGAGSGFFINAQGNIVTNYHVVAQAVNVHIQIPTFGMERFDADIIGASPERDIALLKVTDEALKKIQEKLKPIPFLELGDSDHILRSQEVLALGYPLGQTRLKSTLGIVSGRERLGYFGYIQVTTPLNPGNSGGPALNVQGDVIGINSRSVLEAQNVGYIIPINEVKTALKDLYHVQILRKPTLGCLFTWATPELVEYLGNPGDGGWYIAKVFENTLLEEAGVQADDMLYEINGHRIDRHGELDVPWSEDKVSLFELLNRYTIGDTIDLLVYRKGKPLTFSFKLAHKYLPAIRMVYSEFEKEMTGYEVFGGMVVMNLTLNHIGHLISKVPALVKYGRIENQQKPAVVITHVLPNSQAAKAKVLSPGEVIQEVNGEKIETLDDFRQAVIKSKNDGYLTVKTSEDLYGALSLEKIINDEPLFASRYFYTQSKLLEKLV